MLSIRYFLHAYASLSGNAKIPSGIHFYKTLSNEEHRSQKQTSFNPLHILFRHVVLFI